MTHNADTDQRVSFMRWAADRRWTILAAGCALWNSTQTIHHREYVTDYARRHPFIAYALLVGLAYHLKPRPQSPVARSAGRWSGGVSG